MSIETEIQTEVEALKARFSETKALYREVCALLFFRHGITPTTNKLYQYVRKGSMSAPADALDKFWDELRAKARIEVEHPDLPAELKATAAEAIAGIWRHAAAAARDELTCLRAEARADVANAQEDANEAHEAAEASKLEVFEAQRELHDAELLLKSTSDELEAERRAHAGSVARLQELQRLVDDLRMQLQRQQEAFSADLGKARETVEQANGRADAAERRALLEIDQERQARSRAEKQTEALRSQVSSVETRLRDSTQEHTEVIVHLQARSSTAEGAAAVASAESARLQAENRDLAERLAAAERQALQAQTEAQTMRALVDRLAPVTPDATAAPRVRSVRGTKSKG